jgi:hypothetical protein
VIAGVGYEGITIDALVADLVSAASSWSVDVRPERHQPQAGFSRRALSAALDARRHRLSPRATPATRDNRDGFAPVTPPLR